MTIPEPLADFVIRQAAALGFESAEAYVISLIVAARREFEEGRRANESARVG